MSGAGATRDDMLRMAAEIYVEGPFLMRQLNRLRPHIAPFERLVEAVPAGARVLDVGCGGGLFLGLLARAGRISGGVGFDSNPEAIAAAKTMAGHLPAGHGLSFECLPAEAPWPEGSFDVISIVDVIHHVPPAHQVSVIERAAERLAPGGTLLYKDMGQTPAWMALANRLHDLVLARQWIRYLPIAEARTAMTASGLAIAEEAAMSRFWYRHELLVGQRPAP